MKHVAILIIHGAGIHHKNKKVKDSMNAMRDLLVAKFKEKTDHNPLKVEIIYWDEETKLQKRQNELRKTVEANGIRFSGFLNLIGWIRGFLFDIVGDVAAYQPVHDPDLQEASTYVIVHKKIAEALTKLSNSDSAGPDAHLCIIAHSLGSVIASNYIYDLQKQNAKSQPLQAPVSEAIGTEPSLLEQGKTLSCLFTMGSPMALWSLRTGKLNKPIEVPIWVNFFNNTDIISYPLEKLLIPDPGKAGVQDIAVNTGITPMSHFGYWKNKKVINVIVDHLIDVWKLANSTP